MFIFKKKIEPINKGKYVLDTYAWIEYFNGISFGKKVKKILEEDNEIFLPFIVIAELADSFQQGKVTLEWNLILSFILLPCSFVDFSPEVVLEGAEIKKNKRQKHRNFGLNEGIILAVARAQDAVVVTGDHHLTNEDGVLDIIK